MKVWNFVRGGFAAALLLALASALPGMARAAQLEVKIDNFTFGPQKLTVKVGDTVTWINQDDIPHTVVSTGHFRSKALDTDDKYAFTFTTAGTFEYFCGLHPHMQGSIVVETATGSAATEAQAAALAPSPPLAGESRRGGRHEH
jgi:plastocyanin